MLPRGVIDAMAAVTCADVIVGTYTVLGGLINEYERAA